MEYYDVTRLLNDDYYNVVEKPVRSTRMKLELLDHFENCIGCIEQDIDSSSAGSIVANNEQGCRRSCSFTLINVDDKYTLDENNFFWFNRKFKLFLGLTNGIDTFWFTKGVFITSSVSCDSVAHTVDISGVDKYAQLNGDLNVLQADEMDTIFEIGTKIEDVIHDILMLDIGNGFVLDPIEPIIDPEIAKQKLYREYTLSAGGYYGDFLTEIMTCFGCDIFYDALGRLTVSRVFNDDIPYWYAFKSPAYKFNYDFHGYIAPSLSAELNGVNKIIVSTDNTECENAQYTAINHNPRSPLCYDKIGARTLPENGGIITIDAGDPAYGTTEKKCKDYAEYRMMKETCIALKAHFNTFPLFHLNEGDVISITDSHFNLYEDGFIIQSITYPMDTGELTIEATNLKYLNTDIYIDSLYTEIREMEYRIMYDKNGGVGFIGTNIITSSDENFVARTGYNTTTHKDEFSREGYEFNYWIDDDGNKYYPNSTYANPLQNIKLKANWKSVEDRELIIELRDAESFTHSSNSVMIGATDDDVESIQVGNEKYYYRGRGMNNNMLSISFPDGSYRVVHRSTGGNYNASWLAVLSGIGGVYRYSLAFPNVMETFPLNNLTMPNSAYKKMTLPREMTLAKTSNGTGYTSVNTFYQYVNLEELDFNNKNPLEVSAYVGSNSSYKRYFLCNCAMLNKVNFRNSVHINNTYSISGTATSAFHTFENLNADIIINGDLTLSNTLALTASTGSTTEESTFEIKGALILNDVHSSFGNGSNHPQTNIVINNIEHNVNTGIFNGSTFKSITIGDFTNHANTGLFGGLVVSEPLRINNFYTDAGSVITGSCNITEVDIMGSMEQIAGASSAFVGTFVGTSQLKTIRFYGDVTVVVTNNSSFICGNSGLTDVYFYTDNFDLTEDGGSAFQGNGNLTIHGIANGTVQAFAEERGITFVALTTEEIEEATGA